MSRKTTIRRETPPPPRRAGHLHWPTALAKVEKAGGEWLRIKDYTTISAASATACRVRMQYDQSGRFEVVGRTVDGKAAVYARLKPA